MPETIKLEDGTEKVVYSEEEVEELKTKSAEAETLAEENKAISEKLKGFENKDFNFKKLRDMNEEEKARLTETELSLKKKQEELEENQQTFTKNLVDSFKNEALAVLCGNDKTMRDKVVLNYDKIVGDAKTKEEVFEKTKNAYNMLGVGAVEEFNPFNGIRNMQSVAPIGRKMPANNEPVYAADKVDPDLARNLGIKDEDLKKYDAHPFKGSSAETGKKGGFANE